MIKLKALFSFLVVYLKLLPKRKELHRKMVALFLHFNGDKDKIADFISKGQELADFQTDEILIGINHKEYLTPFYPFAFIHSCNKKRLKPSEEICIKK